MSLQRHLATPAATAALGRALAGVVRARAGGVLYLEGPLGAGKTTLARAVLRALGVTGSVRSPTYTLLEPYSVGAQHVVHLDLYRLGSADELEPLGLDAYPSDSHWWFVEWPERGEGRLQPPTLRVRLSIDGRGRSVAIDGPAAGDLLAQGWPDRRRT